MPLTWFAHQVPVVGMKLARHRRFDAVALCVGSMMPDLMYAFSAYVHIDTHRWPSTFAYGIPLAFVLAIAMRRLVAPVVPQVVPDAGRFRLHSYAALATRRPTLATTLLSVTLGIGSHVTLDWFTHPGRPAARWLGYDDITVAVFGVTEPLAGVFQLLGHTVGSLVAVWMLWLIGSRRLLEEWYDEETVRAARSGTAVGNDAARFWSATIAGFAIGAVWGSRGERIEMIQRAAVGALLGCIAGAAIIQQRRNAPSRRRVRPNGRPIGIRTPR